MTTVLLLLLYGVVGEGFFPLYFLVSKFSILHMKCFCNLEKMCKGTYVFTPIYT